MQPPKYPRYAHIGAAIDLALRGKDLEIADLANILGISYMGVCFWIRGDRRMSIENLEAIAKYLETDMNFFLQYHATEDELLDRYHRRRRVHGTYADKTVMFVDQEIKQLASCGFCVISQSTAQENKPKLKYLDRLFANLVCHADDNSYFDDKYGGVSTISKLEDLILKHLVVASEDTNHADTLLQV